MEPLIKDLKRIEDNGIHIDALKSSVGVKIFCVCADNLGAHGLAGFQESFILDKFCRFCLISRGEIGTPRPREFLLRTVD